MKRSRIHTIHNGSSGNSDHVETTHGNTRSLSSSNDDNKLLKVKYLKGLPNEQDALNILNRIREEFLEILQCRKWNVLSLTEMCCCNGNSNNKKKREMMTIVPIISQSEKVSQIVPLISFYLSI